METPSLGGYVAERMKGGSSKADIREELLAVGWSEEEADAAYREGVIILGVPLPSEGTRPTLIRKSSTVDVVINFFSFILLGIIATALGTLFFGIIEQSFPDRLSADPYVDVSAAMSGIHYAVAALLIGFPLYVGALFIWFRTFREDEGRTESRLSQWLTYIVLLAASVTPVWHASYESHSSHHVRRDDHLKSARALSYLASSHCVRVRSIASHPQPAEHVGDLIHQMYRIYCDQLHKTQKEAKASPRQKHVQRVPRPSPHESASLQKKQCQSFLDLGVGGPKVRYARDEQLQGVCRKHQTHHIFLEEIKS
jgi:hypothetical protein